MSFKADIHDSDGLADQKDHDRWLPESFELEQGTVPQKVLVISTSVHVSRIVTY